MRASNGALLGCILQGSAVLAAFAGPDPGVRFIENRHQWRTSILFKASIPQTEIILQADRLQFIVKKEVSRGNKSGAPPPAGAEGGPHRTTAIEAQLYEVSFLNARSDLRLESEDAAATSYNYFLGNDRSRWASRVRGFSTVVYRGVYCNIDFKIYSEGQRMKQDWIVSPHGNPEEIALSYAGMESIRLTEGKLAVEMKTGEVAELEPYAYQEIEGRRIAVPCSYRLEGTVLHFDLPRGYDPDHTLVIDPILIFSGYSGSTYDNWGNSATYDQHGNLYSGGMVTTDYYGSDFPATPGAYRTTFIGGEWDIGVLKYDSSGSNLLYASYIGGNGTESPQSLVVNNAGQLLIVGATSSTNFPVSNGSTFKGGTGVDPLGGTDYYGSDIFVLKMSEDGTALLNATYLGGTANDGLGFIAGDMLDPYFLQQSPLARNYGDQLRSDVITDKSDFVYLASSTLSSDFPNTTTSVPYHGGSHDAVVVKLTPDLSSVVWSSFLGGSGTDAAYSIKLDSTNGVFVAGGTTSADFEGMNGLNTSYQGNDDGWIAHLSPAGDQIIAATYMGTPAYDQTYFIDLNSAGEVYAFGQTQGAYPVHGNVYSNPNSGQFLHKLSADLKTTLFSTVIGSGIRSPDISPTAFLVSDCNTIYLSGWGGLINEQYENYGYGTVDRNYVGGNTLHLPVSANAYQKTTSGNNFYFMVLSNDASQFLYSTFLGGDISWTHVDGGTSRFDKKGIVYHAVCAGCGGNSDFPAVNVPPARQFNRSMNCNNAAFKFDLTLLKARIQTNSVQLNAPGFHSVCIPGSIVFQNESIGGQTFVWTFGDGTTITRPDTSLVVHQFTKPGTYTVKLKAIDAGTCLGKDSTTVMVTVTAPTGKVGGNQVICLGATTTLVASGGDTYRWTTNNSDFTSTDAQPSVMPTDTTLYFVTISEGGCVKKDTVKVSVVPGIDLQFKFSRVYDCLHSPSLVVTNQTAPGNDVFFDFGDGTTSDKNEEVHRFQKDSTYTVKLVGQKDFCTYNKNVVVPIYRILAPNVITPGASPNQNDTFVILYGDKPISTAGINVSLLVFDRWGKTVYQNNNYQGDWSAANLSAGVYYYEAIIQGETTCKNWLQVIK
jgi:hypothetical protein